MSVYRVTGILNYNDHEPGTVFEAVLDPGAEERALKRGSITLLHRSDPGLRPGSYRLPDGWKTRPQEPREGALSLKEA